MADTIEIIDLPGELEAAPADPDVVQLAAEADTETLPKRAVRNADGTVTLTLAYPVVLKFRKGQGEVTEERYEQLVMHRLTGADMRAISAASRETLTTVAIARSTRLSEGKMAAVFDRMDGSDALAAGQVVSAFLGNGTTTGP